MDYSFAPKIAPQFLITQETNFLATLNDLYPEIYFNLSENPVPSFDPFPSLFDAQEKFDSKQYHLFKKISPIKPLGLDLKSKLFEDIVFPIKDKSLDDVNTTSEIRVFYIYAHKNYKARLVYMENGGPKNYMNLNNSRFQIFKAEKEDSENNKMGFYLEKNNRRIGYYTSSPEITELWLSFLRNYCILKSFPFDYNLLEPVRKENFGAFRQNNQRQFSVKIYNTNHYKNYDQVQKLILNEITILRQTHHESIISLHEIHEFRGVIYMVFEPFHSESLHSLFNKKIPINEDQKVVIIEKILKALKYMHSEGIIHRNINTYNILFSSEKDYSDILIADLSLAVYFNKENKYPIPFCGTPGFVAPEVLYGLKYDYKADVFGAGAVFYHLITEISLFPEEKEILKQNYEFKGLNSKLLEGKNFKINPFWLDFLIQLLERFPEDRISAVEGLENRVFRKNGDFNDIYLKNEVLETQGSIPTEGAATRNKVRGEFDLNHNH